MKRIAIHCVQVLIVIGLVSLCWYVMSPPDTWLSATGIVIIWAVSVPFSFLFAGMLCMFNGGFTEKEKIAISPVVAGLDLIAAVGCGVVLFVHGHVATGIMYSVTLVLLVVLLSRYYFSKPVFELPEMDTTELVRHLLDKWDDCEFAYVANAVEQMDKKTLIYFTTRLSKYYGANEVHVLTKLM